MWYPHISWFFFFCVFCDFIVWMWRCVVRRLIHRCLISCFLWCSFDSYWKINFSQSHIWCIEFKYLVLHILYCMSILKLKRRVLLTSALRALFKVSQLRNYSLKKFNISISDALNAQFSIKIYYLKSLKSALRALVNISLKWNLNIILSCQTHLGWSDGINLGPENVLLLKVSRSIFSEANLGGLV